MSVRNLPWQWGKVHVHGQSNIVASLYPGQPRAGSAWEVYDRFGRQRPDLAHFSVPSGEGALVTIMTVN